MTTTTAAATTRKQQHPFRMNYQTFQRHTILTLLVIVLIFVSLNQYYLLNNAISSDAALNVAIASSLKAPVNKKWTEDELLRGIESNPDLLEKIRNRTKLKNTTTNSDTNHSVDEESDDEETSSNIDDNICKAWKLDSLSASFLWNTHLNQIFMASRHSQDGDYTWHDFTAQLLREYMTARRLQTSVKSLPFRYWKNVGEILDIVWKRYRYLQNKSQGKNKNEEEEPRKLHILVMGGSVTMGVQCLNNPVVKSNRFARRNCAWPTRLSIFLNTLVPDLVRLDMITLGGTNTESAKTIWDYALFPQDMPHPDIVIHGYSTNDMHVISEQQAIRKGITLEDMILQMNQNFVRTILRPPSQCHDLTRPTPLLLYYDDYVGNEQRQLLKTRSFGKAASLLANYYGFGLISYADAVRELIYGDTTEDWFSPNNWPDRQVHPGMGMHISSMWLVAYHFLTMATEYCASSFSNNDDDAMQMIPPLKSDKKLIGKPKPIPSGLPPALTNMTSLDDISTRWQQESAAAVPTVNLTACSETAATTTATTSRCILSWVGGMERTFDQPKHLEKRLKPVLVSNQNWQASADNSKLGFEATQPGASFEMKLPVKQLPVQTINLMVMTSYGDKWKDSQIRVDARVERTKVQRSMDIFGFHDRNTSETYNYQLKLLPNETALPPNDVLRVKLTLVGGSSFKIMGMAICDH